VLLPDRSATYSDVVANTGGALVGAVAFAVFARVLASREARTRGQG
jgi:VanZ family protein